MKVLLIDDEPLALEFLKHRLLRTDVEIAETFGAAADLKDWLGNARNEADAVFLDIHLPEMNGIELAEQLLEVRPHLEIVFVTAYDDYAIKAFELNALDYLLKPVSAERIAVTVSRLQDSIIGNSEGHSPANSEPTIGIRLFQSVRIDTNAAGLVALRWRTAKAQEMFLYLLQHRGNLIRKSDLIELLWPESEDDKAQSQLYTSVYLIRKAIAPYSDHFLLSNTSGSYMLTVRDVRVDVEEWERYLMSGTIINEKTIHEYEDALRICSGDYLQEHDYWWAESERHRLRLLWLRTSMQMAEWYTTNDMIMKAVDKYIEITNRHPQAEEAHLALMKLYAGMNQPSLVHRQYQLLEKVLEETLNERPSAPITEWYDQWQLLKTRNER